MKTKDDKEGFIPLERVTVKSQTGFTSLERVEENKSLAGFTLVEVMVVVGIIAILAIMAIPGVIRTRIISNQGNAQVTLKTISTAMENHASSNQGLYPTSFANDLVNVNLSYLNMDYTSGIYHGYNFTCTALGGGILDGTGYNCTATYLPFGGEVNYTISVNSGLTSF